MSEYDVLINKYNALNAGYDQLYPRPMKHASTHVEDGNDPITPSMIGTYNKTEIDTALQKKAPAGYGLGGNGHTVDDWNTCLSNGWYQGNGSTLNGPDKISASVYGAMLVVTRYSNTYQLFVNAAKPYALPQTMARRWTEDGGVTWSEWEYINPPMKLGVEYRTTERYQGKPVYVKAVNCGQWADNKQVTWNEDSAIRPISYTACNNGSVFPYGDGTTYIKIVDMTSIHLGGTSDPWGGNITVTVKYYKTTD